MHLEEVVVAYIIYQLFTDMKSLPSMPLDETYIAYLYPWLNGASQ